MRLAKVLSIAFSLAACCAPARAAAQDTPLIAAAANVQFALTEIADVYHQRSGIRVRVSPGSSGNLARQIRQGAPYQIFLSADERYVSELARDDFTEDSGVLYSVGRIVIVVPHGSPLEADGSLEDLRAAISDGRLRKFAIANPEHAPYGSRAEEALRHVGLWQAIQGRLVFGENISQAAQFATSRNAEGGIIAYSLARLPKITELASFDLIPENWHSPLRQRMVLIKGADPLARDFYQFLQQPEARAVFRKHGFSLPGESD